MIKRLLPLFKCLLYSVLINIVVVVFGLIVLFLILAVWGFMQTKRFGKIPKGERLERIQKSPNFQKNQFKNINITPDLTEGVGYFEVTKEFLFQKNKRNKPKVKLPNQKIDLKNLSLDESILVWFGHSSYFLQVDGKRVLVDPVLSGAASPIKATTKSFEGTDAYTTDDFPEIDYLLISHDHWDHLDYKTIVKLKSKVKKVITGLGVGAHFERWGFDVSKIVETDWYDVTSLENDFKIITCPARHFSGRGFARNKSIWVSFVLQTPNFRLYLGGDSGYDAHFKEIGQKYGPFDWAILECGQYDKNWKYIHMMPEEVVQATIDLKAHKLLPVHWAKFSLGLHDWDDPIIRVVAAAAEKGVLLVTPIIGSPFYLRDTNVLENWWVGID